MRCRKCERATALGVHIEAQFSLYSKQIEKMRKFAKSSIGGWVMASEDETRSWTPRRLTSEPKVVALPVKIQ